MIQKIFLSTESSDTPCNNEMIYNKTNQVHLIINKQHLQVVNL